MTVKSDNLVWNEKKQRWEDKDGNVGYNHKRVCEKCNKPRYKSNDNRIRQNGELNDCDFILLQDDFGNYEIRYNDEVFHFLWEVAPILNKQQAIIQREMGEKINAEEKLSYMIWKYNKLKQKNFDLQVKLSEVMKNED